MKKLTFAEASDRVLRSQKLNEATGCMEWTAGTSNGYGMQSIGGRMHWAHRVAFEIANGPIPSGLYVLHRCDNPRCVNPAHLFLGTHADNMADKAAKGLGGHKLTVESVIEMRSLLAAGTQQKEAARRFGVAQSMVSKIARGRAWPAAVMGGI